MKILGVKFKNINNLAGEWEIRFDRPPLSDTRLFAIVGPNGSGKSSILDALTLALYGETSRLRSPESEILSRQIDDSYSEATFSVGDALYRSRWSVRRTNGGAESPQMTLARLDNGEAVLEDRVVRVRDRLAELTGLDFKRFCCSILLAQGKYAAFLNALEAERADILEEIIGPEMAQELAESIRSRAEIESERLHQMKEAAANFPFPAKARIEEIRQSYEQAQEDIRETDRSIEDLQATQAWLKRLERLEAAEIEAHEALAEAKAHYGKARSDLQSLERARLIKPLEEGLKSLDALKADADAVQSQLSRLENDAPSVEARIHELEERLQEIAVELDKTSKEIEERGGDLDDASLRDREIAAESQRFLEMVSEYEAAERSRKENLQQQADVEQQTATIESRRQALQGWIEDHKADADLQTDISALESLLTRLISIDAKLDNCRAQKAGAVEAEAGIAKELEQAERAAQKVRNRVERLTIRKADRDHSLRELLGGGDLESLTAYLHTRKEKLSVCRELVKIGRRYRELGVSKDVLEILARSRAEQDSLSHALAREQAGLAELEGQVRRRDAVRRLGAERTELRSAEPCPLCGALDHPYADKGAPDFTDLDRTIQERDRKIRELQEDLDSLGTRSSGLQAQAETAASIRAEWEKMSERGDVAWPVENVDLVVNETLALTQEIKSLKSRIRRARWQRWRAGWTGRALQRKAEKLSMKEQAKDRLQGDYESQQAILANVTGELQNLEEEERAAQLELTELLQRCGEPAPKPGAEMDLAQQIRRRYDIYRRRAKERDALAEQLRFLDARKEALTGELQRLQERLEALGAETRSVQERISSAKTERAVRYGSMDPIRERQTLQDAIDRRTTEQAELKQEIEMLRQRLLESQESLPQLHDRAQTTQAALEETGQKLLAEAVALGSGSLDEVRKLLLLLEEGPGIVERHTAAEKALADATSRADTAHNTLESARSERETGDSPDAVQRKISEETKRRSLLQQELEAIKRTIKEQSDAEREYRELLQAVAAQEKIYAEATAEQKKLQTQDGAQNRRELQRLMIERLIEQTNRHLILLNGRYTLRLSAAGAGLDLQVADALQGVDNRSVKTLSGGESFVLSLCLALGLSDIAARNRKIESLFLDEGFGALDDEMLQAVLSALKGLRANGKTVGVISHVKRLADAIPTQIRVQKESSGLSRITVVA
jgi:exonuclease SbcC